MFQLIYRKFGNRLQTKDDLLSGLTVALALVPEAVAFAIIAGVRNVPSESIEYCELVVVNLPFCNFAEFYLSFS